MRAPSLATVVVALGISASLGCGDDPKNWKPGRPRIDALHFLQQSPQDPYALLFSLEFTDSNGDLGGGKVHLRIEDKKDVAVLDSAEIFQKQAPPVELDATSGEIEVVVRLQSNVALDQRIEIGFVLEDQSGMRSNDPYVVIQALAPKGK